MLENRESNGIPDETAVGVGRIPISSIEKSITKRKDSIEWEFDIITDEEANEAKVCANNRFTGYAPENIYSSGYPGAVNESMINQYPNYLSQSYPQPVCFIYLLIKWFFIPKFNFSIFLIILKQKF